VDRARVRSALGRTVNVGLAPVLVPGAIEARKSGHSIIEFASAFRRNGRYVILANLPLSGIDGGAGAG